MHLATSELQKREQRQWNGRITALFIAFLKEIQDMFSMERSLVLETSAIFGQMRIILLPLISLSQEKWYQIYMEHIIGGTTFFHSIKTIFVF